MNDPGPTEGRSIVDWTAVDWRSLGIATHQHFPEITSTNDVARSTTGAMPREAFPLLITCERQTQGHGRNGRQWWHREGGLACSIVLPLPAPERNHPAGLSNAAGRLAIWTAICLQETAAHFLPDQLCRIKWPNDLMIADRKNAGILIESVPTVPRHPSHSANSSEQFRNPSSLVVVGIGVNINNRSVSSELPGTDWFSWAETNRTFAVPTVLADFLARWLPRMESWPPPMSLLQPRFAAVDWLHGKRLEVLATGAWQILPNGDVAIANMDQGQKEPQTFLGSYAGIDPHGFLRLCVDNGELRIFPSVHRVHALP